ncbi:MAG TPA: cob(I)yrinic acid a,c-diamide adenosyltransferase [Syntrophales bacterium]|nr:cob(I)yrinic acid a,c-diamide adenosyltransferase [Syntrophales bacterium]HOL59195.1 cob(I)yrinic acid a,c-diamide adenosyltransferase [Syntrophales bacterium]HPO35724.1 cob(I)yrinic acid a,c-diamide adenosyltransferase [Syntrophales bacterium]
MTDKKGIVYILTGDGKGKTTAALGLALRVIGHGGKVYMAQFMKGRAYGENLAAGRYLPSLVIEQYGRDEFVCPKSPAAVDRKLAGEGMQAVRGAIKAQLYDLVILDEINVAVSYGLVPLEEVLELIRAKPAPLDLVLTGRYAPPELIAAADTVSEVREVKHHFRAGVKERAGMEF